MAIKIKTSVKGLAPITSLTSEKLQIEEFSATSFDGQDTILFPAGKSYLQNTNSIFIYIDGKLIPPSEYTEVSSTVVQLANPIVGTGLSVFVRWFNRDPMGGSGQGVHVSNSEPNNKYDGMIWFNPDWAGSIFIWNTFQNQFQEIALKRDIVAAGMQTMLSGGGF